MRRRNARPYAYEKGTIMNKKCWFSFILGLVALLMLSACSNYRASDKNDGFVSNASHVFIDSTSSDVLCFNLAVFSKSEIEKVEYLGLEGTNNNDADYVVSIFDNNIDILNDYEYKGWHIKYCMVEVKCLGNVDNCNFENLVLSIDGNKQTVHFDTAVKHKYSEGNVFSDKLQVAVFPVEFSTSTINTSAGTVYEFRASDDITLNGIRFDEYIVASNIMYSINYEEPQPAEFPIEVKKDQTIKLSLSFNSNQIESTDYVLTNIYFDYTVESTNTDAYCGGVVVFDPIYPINSDDVSAINTLIERIIGEK